MSSQKGSINDDFENLNIGKEIDSSFKILTYEQEINEFSFETVTFKNLNLE